VYRQRKDRFLEKHLISAGKKRNREMIKEAKKRGKKKAVEKKGQAKDGAYHKEKKGRACRFSGVDPRKQVVSLAQPAKKEETGEER